MSIRYVVAPGHEFNYTDKEGDKIVKAAGGRSKMSDFDKARVKFKTVTAGQDCSDMPEEVFNLYLERGWIIDLQKVESEPEPEVVDSVAEVITEESN